MKRGATFKKRLLLLFITSALLPGLVIIAMLSTVFNTRLMEENDKQYANTVLSLAQGFATYIDSMRQLSLSPHVNNDIMDFYLNIRSGRYYTDDYLQFTSTKKYGAAMGQMFTMTPGRLLGACFLSINEGSSDCFVEQKGDLSRTVTSYDYRSQPWYEEVASNDGHMVFLPVHTVDYYTGGSRQVFSLVRMVRNVYTKGDVGIIKVDSDAAALEEQFGALQLSANSSLMLLDGDSRPIYSRGAGVESVGLPVENGTLTQEGIGYSLYTQPVGSTPWRIVYLASQRDSTVQQAGFISLLAAVALVVLVVGYLIFRRSSRRMSTHVADILATMKQVAQGDLAARADTDNRTNDEFDLISSQLNQMIDSLSKHIDSEYQALVSQKNAEFLALQTQINPHFLYNILNGLVTLNRLGEAKLLEQSIMQLTGMFRYTCSGGDETTLGRELDFARQYLSLQQLRFGDRLSFTVEAEPGTEDTPLPKMLIQPLVENAIIHGMEPVDRPVHIQVVAQKRPDGVSITVEDDGRGLDAEQLKTSKRVGLSNVKERLAWFSPGSRLEIDGRPGATRVEVLLAAKEETGDHTAGR